MTRHLSICLGIVVVVIASWPSQAQTGSPANAPRDGDGWVTAEPESQGVAAKPLHEMETAIRAGEYKKIGSVLIARHGKLIYEGYFDGDEIGRAHV